MAGSKSDTCLRTTPAIIAFIKRALFHSDVVSEPFYQEEIDKANELISRLNNIDKLNEVPAGVRLIQ